ncbi:hypothetical protein STXM2123_5061 [Streptomyces sp. F-3]|uniref:hypothetical protein n=1 Tax=Streptomyces TaxID=1883 RepID=UPI0007C33CDA|nr:MULTISPECIES: hypothetical protein [unclassified Streptomyces]MDN5384018.1 hypothetical protein [Streptomyces sp. LB8]GAT84360.1 hypothetical protein STXM2123_5061 [Streptomyces sp. F-3]
MPEGIPLRCPACHRTHICTVPDRFCSCGARIAPWGRDEDTTSCSSCGRPAPWPRPELICPCGEVLRPAPSATAAPAAAPATVPATEPPHDRLAPNGPPKDRAGKGGQAPEADEPKRRAFRGVPVRTARDAVTAVVAYLRWLGYEGIRRADQRPPSGVALAARGLVAQVDPSARPASLRDVECLWLTAMTESARCVHFSLAGYGVDARARADELGIPLFVLDRAGIPRPVNEAAETLHTHGA